MICIKPMAPLGDRARTSPRLSARMTARIQDDGTKNRRDASATKPANGSAVTATLSGFVTLGSAFATLTPTSSTTVAGPHRQSRQISLIRLLHQQTAAGDMAGTEEDTNRSSRGGAGQCLKVLDMVSRPL